MIGTQFENADATAASLPGFGGGRMLWRMRVRMVAGCLVGVVAGCAPAVSTGSFEAPDPASKIYAMELAVRNNDRAATPKIIEQLDSDDPAVRLVAISALERLTGETMGYCHYAPLEEREAAIARWVAATSAASEQASEPTEAEDTEDAMPHGG